MLIPVISRAVDPSGRLHTSLLNSWVYGSSRLSSVVAEAVAVLTDGAAAPGAAAAGGLGGGAAAVRDTHAALSGFNLVPTLAAAVVVVCVDMQTRQSPILLATQCRSTYSSSSKGRSRTRGSSCQVRRRAADGCRMVGERGMLVL